MGLIIGVLAGLLYAAAEKTTYTASAYAVVVPEEKDPAAFQAASSVAQGYARVATRPSLVAAGLRAQKLFIQADEVRRYVRVSASPDTPLLEIFATRPDPAEAGRLADAVLEGLVANSSSLRPEIGYRVQRFVATSIPNTPSNPSVWFYAGLGGAAGLLVGGVIAFTLGQAIGGSQLRGVGRSNRPPATDEPQLAPRGVAGSHE